MGGRWRPPTGSLGAPTRPPAAVSTIRTTPDGPAYECIPTQALSILRPLRPSFVPEPLWIGAHGTPGGFLFHRPDVLFFCALPRPASQPFTPPLRSASEVSRCCIAAASPPRPLRPLQPPHLLFLTFPAPPSTPATPLPAPLWNSQSNRQVIVPLWSVTTR